MIWTMHSAWLGFLNIPGWPGRMLEAGLVVLGVFIVLSLAASLFRFEALTLDEEAASDERDLSPQSFAWSVISRLGTGFSEPGPFLFVLVRPRVKGGTAGEGGKDAAAEPAWLSLAGRLRERLRAEDTVRRHEENMLGLLVETRREHASLVIERLLRGLSDGMWESDGYAVDIGVASYPENGTRPGDLFAAAEEALEQTSRGQPWQLAPFPGEADPEKDASDQADPDPSSLPDFLDPLTRVVRPARIQSAILRFMATHRRGARAVSFLYLDMDRLEHYNVRYGRAAGDALLRETGALLRHIVREDDLIGRYEGDTFLLALVCPVRAALGVAQRVLGRLQRLAVSCDGHELHAGATIGVAGYPPHDPRPQQLFQAAQRAFEAARARGGGLCLMYDPDMMDDERPQRDDSPY